MVNKARSQQVWLEFQQELSLPQGRKDVPQVSLKCRDNWSTWLSKHEKSAGAARISAGAFLAPGMKICPSSVPRVPQVSLKQYIYIRLNKFTLAEA